MMEGYVPSILRNILGPVYLGKSLPGLTMLQSSDQQQGFFTSLGEFNLLMTVQFNIATYMKSQQ